GVLLAALLVVNADCQTLAPVDISAFGKDHPLGAVLTQVSSSECRGAGYIKSGESHHDDLSYDIHVSAVLILENHSTRAVMVYKGFDPTMVAWVAGGRRTIFCVPLLLYSLHVSFRKDSKRPD